LFGTLPFATFFIIKVVLPAKSDGSRVAPPVERKELKYLNNTGCTE